MEYTEYRSEELVAKLLIFGAGDRIRTGDVQLGKLAFYH